MWIEITDINTNWKISIRIDSIAYYRSYDGGNGTLISCGDNNEYYVTNEAYETFKARISSAHPSR